MRRLLTYAALGWFLSGTAAQADVIPFHRSEYDDYIRKHNLQNAPADTKKLLRWQFTYETQVDVETSRRWWSKMQRTGHDPYLSELERRIKKAWIPPRGQGARKVSVLFKLHRDGSISELRIHNYSGVNSVDKAALLATTKASPFRPLPAGSPESVEIEFTFDYVAACSGQVYDAAEVLSYWPTPGWTDTVPDTPVRKPYVSDSGQILWRLDGKNDVSNTIVKSYKPYATYNVQEHSNNR